MNRCYHSMIRNLIILLVAVACFVRPELSQGQQTFYKTYGHVSQGGEGRTIIQTQDGGYYFSYVVFISGRAMACISKLNCAGDKEWEKFFDNGTYTMPVELIEQQDGGSVVLFTVQDSSLIWKATVMRLDAFGNAVWSNTIHHRIDEVKGFMKQHADGRIFVCGTVTDSISTILGTSLACLSPDGILLWHKHFTDANYYAPLGLTITADDRIAVFGVAKFIFLPFTDIFLLTCSTDGVIIKKSVYGTFYDDEPKAICSDDSGNLYLTGRSYFVNSEWDFMFMKLDTDLNVSKFIFFDAQTPQGDIGRDIIYTKDKKIAIFGDEGAWEQRNLMLVKLDTEGSILWSKHYTISPNYTNYTFYGSQTSEGGYLMTGDARPAIQFRIAPLLLTDSYGNLGCYTSDFQLYPHIEIADVAVIPAQSTSLTPFDATSPIPPPVITVQTNRTNFCTNMLPCGVLTSQTDTVCPEVCFNFSQSSINASGWEWTFQNGTPSHFSGAEPPAICFSGHGPWQVSLSLSNSAGTVEIRNTVLDTVNCPFYLPNIFTPNGDGVNDVFYATGVYDFSLCIFNRWGSAVFESKNPGLWWNGTSKDGKPLPDGVYYFVLKDSDRMETFKGTVTLIR